MPGAEIRNGGGAGLPAVNPHTRYSCQTIHATPSAGRSIAMRVATTSVSRTLLMCMAFLSCRAVQGTHRVWSRRRAIAVPPTFHERSRSLGEASGLTSDKTRLPLRQGATARVTRSILSNAMTYTLPMATLARTKGATSTARTVARASASAARVTSHRGQCPRRRNLVTRAALTPSDRRRGPRQRSAPRRGGVGDHDDQDHREQDDRMVTPPFQGSTLDPDPPDCFRRESASR